LPTYKVYYFYLDLVAMIIGKSRSLSDKTTTAIVTRLTLTHIISIFVLFITFHLGRRTRGNWIYRMPRAPAADTYSLVHCSRVGTPKQGERVIYPNYMVRAAAVAWKRRGVKLALGALIVREGLLVGDCH